MKKKNIAQEQGTSSGTEQGSRIHYERQKVIVQPAPSLETWRKLYQLADEIKIVAPWTWMDEYQLFAIQINTVHELVYSYIVGNAGEYSAISLCLGAEGLASYNAIQEHTQDLFDLYMNQKCLMLTYDDSDLLKEYDKQVFKRLKSKYRGKNAFPLFRFHEPGYDPWFLSENQAQFLLVALPKIIDVAMTVKKNKDYLFNDEGYIRLFALDDSSDVPKWVDSWVPGWISPQEIKPPRLDELRVNRIINSSSRAEEVWELDYFYTQTLITDAQKPYCMQAAMVVDQLRGTVVDFDFIMKDAHETVVEKIFDAMEKFKCIPKEIQVYKSDLYDLLEGMSILFGFEISLVDKLPGLSNARDALADALSK